MRDLGWKGTAWAGAPKGVSLEHFEEVRLKKREARGGFDGRLFLVGVE